MLLTSFLLILQLYGFLMLAVIKKPKTLLIAINGSTGVKERCSNTTNEGQNEVHRSKKCLLKYYLFREADTE